MRSAERMRSTTRIPESQTQHIAQQLDTTATSEKLAVIQSVKL